jgi:uridine nucleosidase
MLLTFMVNDANKPYERDRLIFLLLGSTGIDGTDLLPGPEKCHVSDIPAVEAMRSSIESRVQGTVWIVATGALTNVALLFATYPHLVQIIAGLSIMGGAIGNGFTKAPMGAVTGEGERIGNITPFAEFNIYASPTATVPWRHVLLMDGG